jgi:excisionase family DNA binding protein
MEKPKYHIVPEVEKVLNLTKRQVYKKIHKGELEAIRAGRKFLIPSHVLSVNKKNPIC